MADDRERKKELKREARRRRREQEAAEWEDHMVLEPEELKDLLDFIDAGLKQDECDGSLRLTMAWADGAGVEHGALERSVVHFGGACDCEVLGNVDPESRVDTWPRYMAMVQSHG